MKFTTIALCVLAFVCVASAIHPLTAYKQFKSFEQRFEKTYIDSAERAYRFRVFQDNLVEIQRLQRLVESEGRSARFGVNVLADMSPNEFRETMLNRVQAPHPEQWSPEWPVATPPTDPETLAALPESFDWREKGAVTPVKNQGQCGSCWSFSTTGNVEGQHFLAAKKPLVGLSEQNLVDCDHECMQYDGEKSCDSGCQGGLQPNAYRYIIGNKGIDSETSYPYTAADGTCQFNAANVAATISNYTMISKNETAMAVALTTGVPNTGFNGGPLAIAADAATWQFYIGGVYDLPCGHSLDHGILIVGYGVEKGLLHPDGLDYWLIKNSWGASWGEKGYLKVERGDGKCGLNLFVSTSIIDA